VDNGVITKAKDAALSAANASVEEGIELLYNQYCYKSQGKTNFIDWLESNGYIDSDGVIDVEEVLGGKLNYGNGSNSKDVYVMSVGENKYVLSYLNSSTKEIVVGEISEENATLAELNYKKNKDKYLQEAIELGQGSTNKDVGIGTDGNVVNLDLWNYSMMLDGESIRLGEYAGSNTQRGGYIRRY
jgi:hypothetical protein